MGTNIKSRKETSCHSLKMYYLSIVQQNMMA